MNYVITDEFLTMTKLYTVKVRPPKARMSESSAAGLEAQLVCRRLVTD